MTTTEILLVVTGAAGVTTGRLLVAALQRRRRVGGVIWARSRMHAGRLEKRRNGGVYLYRRLEFREMPVTGRAVLFATEDVKIGRTRRRPKDRAAEWWRPINNALKTERRHGEVQLIGLIPGAGHETETLLHRAFRRHRGSLGVEWFVLPEGDNSDWWMNTVEAIAGGRR